MTVEAYSSLPFQAGGAVAAAAGRAALWAIAAYMRAAAAQHRAGRADRRFRALAGGNALYKQAHHHPAPLFGSFDASGAGGEPAKTVAPVMPAARPTKLADRQRRDHRQRRRRAINAGASPAIGNDDVIGAAAEARGARACSTARPTACSGRDRQGDQGLRAEHRPRRRAAC